MGNLGALSRCRSRAASLQRRGKSRAKNFGDGLQKKNQLGAGRWKSLQKNSICLYSAESFRASFCTTSWWITSVTFCNNVRHLPAVGSQIKVSARLREVADSSPPAKLWCSLLVWMKSVGQVSVLIRAALLGDGDWQYHVLKRENSFPCLLRLNVIGCFRSQGYKMGGRPSCAPQCHFQRGLNSVSQRHTLDLRNVRVYVTSETSALISKACHERNIHLLLKRYLKDLFFLLPFLLLLKA